MGIITVVTVASAFIAFIVDSLAPTLAGLFLAILLAVFTFGGLLWLADRYFSIDFTSDLQRMFPQLGTLVNYSQQLTNHS